MDNRYLHALRILPGRIGTKTLTLLIERFGDGEAVWRAPDSEIFACPGLGPKSKDALIAGRKAIDPDQEWETLEKIGVDVFSLYDPFYPALLKQIPDAPYLLYARGQFDWERPQPMIALVGSRKYTPYGEQAAGRIAEDLTRAGVLVVSGLAFGIDSVAHKGALEAGGETIAVLGSGIDDASITPQTHFPLAEKIMRSGALVAEYPPGTPATVGTFPARNRIIAGMSLGTVVIEAAEESGSLITARLALDYDREVFAIPGSIFSPASSGTNQLIKQGAKMVSGVSDILEELPELGLRKSSGSGAESLVPKNLSPDEAKVLRFLSHEPLHVDKIIKAATLETATINSLLALLEVKGLIRNIGGMHYIRL